MGHCICKREDAVDCFRERHDLYPLIDDDCSDADDDGWCCCGCHADIAQAEACGDD